MSVKSKNIHVLPTEKPSRLIQAKNDILILLIELAENNEFNLNKHIYITSDEEINKNTKTCWCIDTYNNELALHQGVLPDYHYKNYKKIIMTTDTSINVLCGCGKDCGAKESGVQAIDDEFLEWFVKNPSCEEIETFKVWWSDDSYSYETIIPKEEPKQHVEFINNNIDQLDKAIESFKQETLEEAYINMCRFKKISNDREYIGLKAAEWGAKWQQEQDQNKYSDEEVKKIALDFFYFWWNAKGTNTEQGFDKWFEQFKIK